jgi:GMP synthase-like glutamine amidotransferase
MGARFTRADRDDPSRLPGLADGADLLVLLGSDWSVHDQRNRSLVEAEQLLVRRAAGRGLPVLGICYGGQLVASTLGCTVERAPLAEIGWRSVVVDDRAVVPAGPWFEYHFDRWTDAGPVSSVAHTGAGPQAFWYGRTFAVQFHPEATSDMIRRWVIGGAAEVTAAGEDAEAIIEESDRLAPVARERCVELLTRFVEVSNSSIAGGAPTAVE